MDTGLPTLVYEDLAPTRDYLQDVARVLGKLQQLFLPANPHDWQRGLVVTGEGLATQPCMIDGKQYQAVLDLYQGTVKLGAANWQLIAFSAPELLKNLQVWLSAHGVKKPIEQPEFATKTVSYEPVQAERLGAALQWLNQQFQTVATDLKAGLVSPILLYPHHFDLSLVWFPGGDEQQLSLGFSLGDETIPEPYLYITAYPEPKGFMDLDLPYPARWQTEGFSAAIVLYADLVASQDPARLIRQLWTATAAPMQTS